MPASDRGSKNVLSVSKSRPVIRPRNTRGGIWTVSAEPAAMSMPPTL
jgi:hypothetical protein